MPEEQAYSIVSNNIMHPRGEAHLVAKSWYPGDNRLELEGLGEGVVATGVAAAEGGVGGVTQGEESAPPSPLRRRY